ncbi:hypothetical protein H632_c1756p0 [Helicosporidium sp. ATCC 50920]|nr:hypothetical protein H632_c1756p0 [Helicosporidium sp. ATCC 50920]|eukprot:KDD73888.1 hypothetical protein H632_c1756p0 [Helicosporidium sp. ATCC 50920]
MENGAGPADDGAPQSSLPIYKADLSYSYWTARSSASSAPPPAPKLLSEEEVAAQRREQEFHAQSGASMWNRGGTFEERAVGISWIREEVAQLARPLARQDGRASVSVLALKSCSGEATQWIVRGKKRAGFELSIEVDLQGKVAKESGEEALVQGTLSACADELDEMESRVQFDEVDVVDEGDLGQLTKAGKSLHEDFLRVMQALVERIKSR